MQEPKARQYEIKTNAEFVVRRLATLRRREQNPASVPTQRG